MVLFIECIIGCIVFGVGIISSVLANKEFWIQDYPPMVQKRYIELHPDYKVLAKKEETKALIIKKVLVCILFIGLLSVMVYFAGANSFISGFAYCYVIWLVVNLFDLIVLDIGILAYWKKTRLEGTEDMDKEYCGNYKKHIIDFGYGMGIGLVVASIVGGVSALLF
ncbi:MAG: hypothetical protein PHR92_10450 [Lachnospiraceae bacterium]|nr:hypothetical protein [Lachnospiraceae bacterium]